MSRLSLALRRQWLNLILSGILGLLLGACWLEPQGPRDLLNLSLHRAQLVTQNAQLRAENANLEKQLARLTTDDAYVQQMIREELGYTRPDDFVYRFRSNDAPER